MPQDPRAHFDELTLETIEHSPIGAVPHTPSYVEALVRLYATRQVYPNADHRGGHVTARSLAGRPTFQANNLDALAAGQIEPTALEPNQGIFDRYLASLPAADRTRAGSHRLKVTGKPVHHRKHHGPGAPPVHHDPVHSLFLVPGTGIHPGLPGNYLYGSLFESNLETGAWAVHLHDSEDGASFFDAPNLAEALAKVRELLESAPFHLGELEVFGFRPN
jgi:hypothetical protein